MRWRGLVSWTILASGAGCAPQVQNDAVTPRIEASAAPGDAPSQSRNARAAQRFISVNVPNLHYVEDDWQFDSTQRYRLPDEFEIRDALESVRQMGGRVVRIYALSVRKTTDPVEVPRHVLGPGQFNENAFQTLDLVLALAREYQIQIIVPLVDNWQWWGGVNEYAAFRGLPRRDFWTSPQLFADFQRTIEFVVTRKNTVNGVVYRDDPTIYAWETGNELEAPWEWTERAAHAVRQLDPQHWIADGIHSREVREEALNSPLIDVLTTHHYTSGAQMVTDVQANLERIAGAKPYFVGEYGFIPASEVEQLLTTVVEGGALGAMIWSLRSHNRDGGFYAHAEKPGFESYHWPGFAAGDAYEEADILRVIQRKASAISGLSVPERRAPKAPTLLPHTTPSALYWQGSAGANGYAVQRSQQPAGPWVTVAKHVSDADSSYRAQYTDPTAVPQTAYYYRVAALNRVGMSEPSNVVGPVVAATVRMVDEFQDLEKIASHSGSLQVVGHNPLAHKMDRWRLATSKAVITYNPKGTIRDIQLDLFLSGEAQAPQLEVSADGLAWQTQDVERFDYYGLVDVPAGPRPVRLLGRCAGAPSQLRIRFAAGAELARLQLDYLPASPTSVPDASPFGL